MITRHDNGRKPRIGKFSSERGFTLVELLVSVSIFVVVMFIATGAVFSIVQANKKTHALKSVMTNLNFALESMMREIRVGTKYSCEGAGDCPNAPGSTFAFTPNRDVGGNPFVEDRIEYSLNGGRIQKTIYDGVAISSLITAEEISIDNLDFYVIGSGELDNKQPKVVISIKGYSGTGDTRSDFTVQTSVSQRALDQ